MHGYGYLSLIGLLVPIFQVVIGILALRVHRLAGILMIVGPILSLLPTIFFSFNLNAFSGNSSDGFMIAAIAFPMLAGSLFFVGTAIIVLQASALKKQAREQEILLDELLIRQGDRLEQPSK